MTDLTKLPEPPKLTPKEHRVLKTIGDANMRGAQLTDKQISDLTELTREDVRMIIGSLISKGYIKGVVLPKGGAHA